MFSLTDNRLPQLAIELDFRSEVTNANRLRACLKGNKLVTVPRIHDNLSTERMIIMEWIQVRGQRGLLWIADPESAIGST